MASRFALAFAAAALAPAPAWGAKLGFVSALRGGTLRTLDVPDEHAVVLREAAHADVEEEFDDAVAAQEEAQDELGEAEEDSVDDAQGERVDAADNAEDLDDDTEDDAEDASEAAARDSSVATDAHARPREEGEEGASPLAGFAEHLLVEEATKPSRDSAGELAIDESAGAARKAPSRVAQTFREKYLEDSWAGARRLGFSPSAQGHAHARPSTAKAAADHDEAAKAEAQKLIAEVKSLTEDNATARLAADSRAVATRGSMTDENEVSEDELASVSDSAEDTDESNDDAADGDSREETEDTEETADGAATTYASEDVAGDADAREDQTDMDSQSADSQASDDEELGSEAEELEPAQEGASGLASFATHALEAEEGGSPSRAPVEASGSPSQATVEAELNAEADKLGLMDDSSA